MSTFEPINPISDPRVKSCFEEVNGRGYHYLRAEPPDGFKDTLFLIHGWPDISVGWRNQIPFFLSMEYRVICPDLMGFGGTDAPEVPPAESLKFYGFKRAADDVKELARSLGTDKIALGGHDWGGAVVYRIALWYPELVKSVFSVCTPYWPPSKKYTSLGDRVKYKLPNFTYQLQLASGEVEKHIQTKEQIRQFLNALYGGRGPNGEFGFDVNSGMLFDNLSRLGPTPLMSKNTLDYYVDQYARNGIHSTLNWYRTTDQNYHDELGLDKKTIDVPVLFIQATKDSALPASMSQGMEEWCSQLTRRTVDTHHWALWEAPDAINTHVRDWVQDTSRTKSSL